MIENLFFNTESLIKEILKASNNASTLVCDSNSLKNAALLYQPTNKICQLNTSKAADCIICRRLRIVGNY